jgi:hypothetical protein
VLDIGPVWKLKPDKSSVGAGNHGGVAEPVTGTAGGQLPGLQIHPAPDRSKAKMVHPERLRLKLVDRAEDAGRAIQADERDDSDAAQCRPNQLGERRMRPDPLFEQVGGTDSLQVGGVPGELHQPVGIVSLARQRQEAAGIVGCPGAEHENLDSLCAPQRLEDKAIPVVLAKPLTQIIGAPEAASVEAVAGVGIVDGTHAGHREPLLSKGPVEEQLVAERRPVLYRIE